MRAVKNFLILSCLAVLSAAEVERPVSKLEAMLESIGLEGVYEFGEEMVTWAWTLISDFGVPSKEVPMETNAAPVVFEHPSKVQSGQVKNGWRGESEPPWKMWKPWSREGGHEGHGGRFTMWGEIRTCHEKCGEDHDCHEKCPKPWELKEKKCEEFTGIKTCHKSCGHDFECHKKCPMPTYIHAAERVQEALDCHGQCISRTGGHDCHRACPKPMKHFEAKCQRFENARTCHQACKREDHECHRGCWYKAHADDEDDEGHHHHHGWLHQDHAEDEGRHHHHHGWWHHDHEEDGGQHHHHNWWQHVMKKVNSEVSGEPSGHHHPWFKHHEGQGHPWHHPWHKRWEHHNQSPEAVSTTKMAKPDLHV